MGGRTIRLFLLDGSQSGLRTAEVGLSTIKGVYVPRGALQVFAKREEARRTGIYILLGADPTTPGRMKLYVGEADDVLLRLLSHNKDAEKDFWDRSIVFVSKDQNLTKAHVRYLEARLIDLATKARRATVDNKTGPIGRNLPEADLAEMEAFIEQVNLLLSTMGIDAFDQAPSVTASRLKATELSASEFRMSGEGYDATCLIVESEFVVQKGSTARVAEANSLGDSTRAKRRELLAAGVLVAAGTSFRFAQDYSFGSVSGAAQLVCGANVNGRTSWKTKDGKTFADWQEKQIGNTVKAATSD
jgi:hypothetical protein